MNENENVTEVVEEPVIKKIHPTDTAEIIEPLDPVVGVLKQPKSTEEPVEEAPVQQQQQQLLCIDINSRVDIKSLMSKLFSFQIVSYEAFRKAVYETSFRCEEDPDIDKWIKSWYDGIKLPQASTKLSAGFDFYAPFNFRLTPKTELVIPTGIKWTVNQPSMEVAREYLSRISEMKVHSTDGKEYKDVDIMNQWIAQFASTSQVVSGGLDNIGLTLMIFPRSGSSFKYNIRIANTVGIIDEDYYLSESTEGQIMIKMCMDQPRHNRIMFTGSNSAPVVTIDDDSVLRNDKWDVNTGDAFAQAIVVPYVHNFNFTTEDTRDGGFGSTDK